MKSQSRFAAIALVIVTSLILSTLATIHSAKACGQHSSITASQTAPEIQSEPAPGAILPSHTEFQVKHVFIGTTPNFTRPIRRAPIRRKGRIQH